MMKIKRSNSLSALRHVDRVVLTLGGKRRSFRIRDEIRIIRNEKDELDLYHAERFAFWRRILVEKTRERREAENNYYEELNHMVVQMPEILRQRNMSRLDTLVRAHAHLQPSVLKAKSEWDAALHSEDLARMMCDVFEHRKAVLMKKKYL